jgi:hypothetical protein
MIRFTFKADIEITIEFVDDNFKLIESTFAFIGVIVKFSKEFFINFSRMNVICETHRIRYRNICEELLKNSDKKVFQDIDIDVFLNETKDAFNLIKPDKLIIKVVNNYCDAFKDHRESPGVCYSNTSTIFIRQDLINDTSFLRKVLIHEILHACGDCLNNGIARHNICATEPIFDFLSKIQY